ncbi:MAG: hypothetical protein RIC55_32615 [Pirellulaceae bacterium]
MSRCTAISYLFVAALVSALLVGANDLRAQESGRVLAPGVLTTIKPEPKPEETFHGPKAFTRITGKHPKLNFTPNLSEKTATVFEMSQQVTLRNKVWTLEFSFKPLRMIYIDIPEAPGVLKRKLVWYMVYRVRNTGMHIEPKPAIDEFGHTTYTTGPASHRAFFFPHFVLEGEYFDKEKSEYVRRAYLDRIIPEARVPIQLREDPQIPLRNSAEMMRAALEQPVSADEAGADSTAWGVVTWMDVNPQIDFVSVYVQGLTNAFQFEDNPDGSGAVYRHKTLQLNFWRPGDSYLEHEKEFRYGVPIVDDKQEQRLIFSHYNISDHLDHLWIFR